MSSTIVVDNKKYSLKFEENPSLSRVEEATDLFCQEMSNGSGIRKSDRSRVLTIDLDALAVFLTWGDKNLLRPMAGAMIHAILRVSGHLYVATDEDDKLIGYTAWLPKGNKLYETNPEEETKSKYFADYNSNLPQEAGPIIGKTMAEASAHIDEVTKIHDAERETYWCMIAIVSKPYQQHGIGSALFQLTFAKAKETEGLDLALATTWQKNLAFYARPQLHFQVAGHTKLAMDTKCPWDNYVLLRKNEDL
ncbi:hypothetical protein BS17DRAFT_763810 [Gyrodon lividus]|nr:hypothetical protein BS17DRAFT_763810 [Gyrodon lividus]